VTVEAISQPLLDSDQDRVGLLVLLNDVTQLRRLETIRSDFASNVSHELRTPITNIRGYVETMLEVGCGNEAQTRRFLEIIRRNTGRLEAIIEDLLALAQLEQSRKIELPNRLPVPVRRLVESSVAQFTHAAKDKNMSIRLVIEDQLGVLGAPQLLEQAVSNLLSNAVTYGPRDSVITIRGRALNEERIEISVIDEGPGIAPDHLPRLFERFYRVDKARSREQGGTGLGLAIVKHIARAHGGHVEVDSRLGEGSTFRLVMPRARP
jgi:two-component system phosphate regulon sensor histidine kinase PhoR